MTTETTKRVGRPKKAELTSKTKRNKVGRPKGEAGIIAEYRARMLSSPKSRKVLDSILEAASTDGHPNQAAAWKLWMDRALPVSAFDAKKGNGEKPSVTINVTGLGGSVSVEAATEPMDADYEEVEDDA